MYIPYETIESMLSRVFGSDFFHKFFYEMKILQNVNYIKKNEPYVLKKLYRKLKNNEKINAVFCVYDETKWKCQSLYDLLDNDTRFNVKILVTKNSVTDKNNPNFQTDEILKNVFNFFSEKGANVEYAYNTLISQHIPLRKFNPDIIFYQHPWSVKTEQGPVVCSKFAYTCYIPYYFPIETADIDCKLRFHDYIERYYIIDEYTKQKYLLKNPKLNDKLKAVGYPYLDYFINNKPKEDNCIIYAPHWTVCNHGLAYSTFDWSGKFMLDYAKSHPEIKWIFKPHPLLYHALIDFGLMDEQDVNNYYDEWSNIGIRYEGGDYLEFFSKSKMMITDCSSFLGEYLAADKPLIHLLSPKSQFRTSDNPILKAHYRAETLDELKELLAELPQNDYKKSLRGTILRECGLKDINASKNILEDILNKIQTS